MGTLRNYISLMQFKIVLLLVLSAAAGFVIAYGASSTIYSLALVMLAIAASGAGAEMLNKILERKIDSKMSRTSKRPTVLGKINRKSGLTYGFVLCAVGVFLGYAINYLTALMIFMGLVFYIGVYTELLKTRSRLNIIIGGLAGSFCVWAGVTAASGTIAMPGFILGLLVLVWIPGHIWSFAIKYRKDYIRAGVPMLTSIESKKKGTRIIAAFNILMAIFAAVLVIYLGVYYAAIIAIPIVAELYLSFKTVLRSSTAWTLFKFSSVFLTIIFMAVIIMKLL